MGEGRGALMWPGAATRGAQTLPFDIGQQTEFYLYLQKVKEVANFDATSIEALTRKKCCPYESAQVGTSFSMITLGSAGKVGGKYLEGAVKRCEDVLMSRNMFFALVFAGVVSGPVIDFHQR